MGRWWLLGGGESLFFKGVAPGHGYIPMSLWIKQTELGGLLKNWRGYKVGRWIWEKWGGVGGRWTWSKYTVCMYKVCKN